MNFEDFRKSTLKLNEKRNHKIKNSVGVRDIYKMCLKSKKFKSVGRVSEHEFYKITRTVNNLLAQELINGNDVKLPKRMGQLEVRKFNLFVKFVEGKIKTNRGIDWQATLKLWYEDEEAKAEKILVRKEDTERYIIFYNRATANYNNKTLYQFKPNRELICAIRKAGKEGLIDAYKIGK